MLPWGESRQLRRCWAPRGRIAGLGLVLSAPSGAGVAELQLYGSTDKACDEAAPSCRSQLRYK